MPEQYVQNQYWQQLNPDIIYLYYYFVKFAFNNKKIKCYNK